jgi:hypothetical protein
MLENLIKVSVDYICAFLTGRNKDNFELINYENVLRTGKHFVLEELSRKLRGNKPVVTIEEFNFNCKQLCGNRLFDASFFRDKSYLFGMRYQNSLNTQKLEKAKKRVDLFENQDKKMNELLKNKTFSSRSTSKLLKKENSLNQGQTSKDLSLFQPQTSKNMKENFRYGHSSTSPKRLTLNRANQDFSENESGVDRPDTVRMKYFANASLNPTPMLKASRTEVGIRKIFKLQRVSGDESEEQMEKTQKVELSELDSSFR